MKKCPSQEKRDLRLRLGAAHGSIVIPLVLSSIGGVLATLLFVNLVRYVSGTNAIEQVARKVARCITPTDAECNVTEGAQPPADFNWYGYPQIATNINLIQEFNYSARLQRDTYFADYMVYLQHMVIPELRFPEHTLIQKTFENRLNSGMTITGSVIGNAEEPYTVWRPTHDSVFPHYNEGHEDAYVDLPGWQPYVVAGDPPNERIRVRNFPERGASFPESGGFTTIRKGDIETFATPLYGVPRLGGILPSDNCLTSQDRACPIARSGGDRTWREYAYVAIRFETLVKRHDENDPAQVKIGREVGDGLVIDVYRDCDQPGGCVSDYSRGLGGRDWSGNLSTAPRNFHLRVRGPEGSHGGGTPGDHQAVWVPRGGAFKVRGYLWAQNGPVDARVTIRTFINDYTGDTEYNPPYARTCPNGVQQKPPLNPVECPAKPEDCGFKQGSRWSGNNPCQLISHTTEPTCTGGEFAFSMSDVPEPIEKTAAVCSDSWKPGPITAPAGRLYCGWTENTAKRKDVTVGAVPNGCSLARPGPGVIKLPEQMKRNDNYYGDPMEQDRIKAINQSIGSLEQPSNAPQFAMIRPGDTTYVSREVTNVPPSERLYPESSRGNEKWVFSWTPVDGAIYEQFSERPRPEYSQYRRVDKAVPDKRSFAYLVSRSASGRSIPESFLTDSALANYVKVEFARSSTEPITSIYPFNQQPAFEICPLASGETLEARLRGYIQSASPNHPGANPEYELSVEGGYAGTNVALSDEELSGLSPQPPACTPKLVVVEYRDGAKVPLGAYSSAEFPDGPSECTGKGDPAVTYDKCSSTVINNENLEYVSPEVGVNLVQAQAVGLRELRRFDRQVRYGCGEAGGKNCVDIAIDAGTDAYATVTVSYELPLTFPLDLLMQRETLPIVHSKKELVETYMVGLEP